VIEETLALEYPKACAEVRLKIDPFAQALAKRLTFRFHFGPVFEMLNIMELRRGQNGDDLVADRPEPCNLGISRVGPQFPPSDRMAQSIEHRRETSWQ
jgi:hypothetical protein